MVKSRLMKAHKVLASVRIDTFAGRAVLSGILDFIDADHPWQLRILQNPNDISAKTIHDAVSEGYDGFILSFIGNDADTTSALVNCDKPLVLIGSSKPGFERRKAPTAFVWTDNRAIGCAGANHLVRLGKFSSYAFVHSRPNDLYSKMRWKGFATQIKARTGRTPVEISSGNEVGTEPDIAFLADALARLPKPTAVMTACDWRALHVLSAAERKRIEIPKQLALIGVDNDELIAAHSHPPLSSIQLGLFNMGLKASDELERLMSARKTRKEIRTTMIPPVRIVERESTGFVKPSVSLVERARRFIREHARDGIDAGDVIAHLGCSRNLADLRFKESEGMTVRAALESARLDDVKRLLKTTNRRIGSITEQCGFKTTSSLAHVFLKRFGVTMGEWRAQARVAAPSPSARGHGSNGKRRQPR